MLEDAIKAIANAEAKAEITLKSSKERAEKIALETKDTISKLRAEEKVKEDKYLSDSIDKATKKGQKMYDASLVEADKKAMELSSLSKEKREQAIKSVIDRIIN